MKRREKHNAENYNHAAECFVRNNDHCLMRYLNLSLLVLCISFNAYVITVLKSNSFEIIGPRLFLTDCQYSRKRENWFPVLYVPSV